VVRKTPGRSAKLTLTIQKNAKIWDPKNGGKLDQGLVDEIIQIMGNFGMAGIKNSDDIDRFVVQTIVQSVRSRLFTYDPTLVEHCYHIGMTVFQAFKESEAYSSFRRFF
jgi:hypothetical protein